MLRRTCQLTMILTFCACGSSAPTCVPGEQTFTFCSDDKVYTCPMGTPEQIARKNEVEQMCQMQSDPIQCLFDADQEMVDAELSADCAGGGQICVDDALSSTASCDEG